jgi:hypothetical protein
MRRSPTSLITLALVGGLALGIVILFGVETASLLPSPDGYTRKDGRLLGGDFIAFYVGGRLHDTDRERTYDFEAQHETRAAILPPDQHDTYRASPFVYPPLVAAVLAPFSRLDFSTAYYLWAAIGIVVSLVSLLYLVARSGAAQVLPWPLLAVLILAYYPYSVQTFITGQAAWIGVSVLALTSAALLRGRPFLAGAVLSASYYKPPLFLFLVVVLLLTQGKRFVLGFLTGAGTLLLLTWLSVGSSGVISYLEAASRYVYGREVYDGQELAPEYGKGLWALGVTFLPSTIAVFAVLAVPIVVTVILSMRLLRSDREATRLFGLVFAMVCTLAYSLQVLWYDLALLLVPMILALVWHGRHRLSERTLALLPLAALYLEMFALDLTLAGTAVHASSFLFIAALGTMGWYGFARLLPRDGASATHLPPAGCQRVADESD